MNQVRGEWFRDVGAACMSVAGYAYGTCCLGCYNRKPRRGHGCAWLICCRSILIAARRCTYVQPVHRTLLGTEIPTNNFVGRLFPKLLPANHL